MQLFSWEITYTLAHFLFLCIYMTRNDLISVFKPTAAQLTRGLRSKYTQKRSRLTHSHTISYTLAHFKAVFSYTLPHFENL